MSVLGTWMWTARDDGHVLDRGAAEILTDSPDLADTALPLAVVAQRLHPDDRGRFLAAVERVERENGLIVVEYRVCTPEGTRWVLDHGRIYPAAAGVPAHGHGVLIDITQQKLAGAEAGIEATERETPLEQAARHALAARRAIDDDGSASLRLLVDMMLLEIGRVLARRLGKARAKALN